jgi:hypothetical protein
MMPDVWSYTRVKKLYFYAATQLCSQANSKIRKLFLNLLSNSVSSSQLHNENRKVNSRI